MLKRYIWSEEVRFRIFLPNNGGRILKTYSAILEQHVVHIKWNTHFDYIIIILPLQPELKSLLDYLETLELLYI